MNDLQSLVNYNIQNQYKPVIDGTDLFIGRQQIDVATIQQMITMESSWQDNKKSSQGAYGLTQFTNDQFEEVKSILSNIGYQSKAGYGAISGTSINDGGTIMVYVRDVILKNAFTINSLDVYDLSSVNPGPVSDKDPTPKQPNWDTHNNQLKVTNPNWKGQLQIQFQYVYVYHVLNFYYTSSSNNQSYLWPFKKILQMPPSMQIAMQMIMYNGGPGKATNILGNGTPGDIPASAYELDDSRLGYKEYSRKYVGIDDVKWNYYRRLDANGLIQKKETVQSWIDKATSAIGTEQQQSDLPLASDSVLTFSKQQKYYLGRFFYLYQKWFNWFLTNGYLEPGTSWN